MALAVRRTEVEARGRGVRASAWNVHGIQTTSRARGGKDIRTYGNDHWPRRRPVQVVEDASHRKVPARVERPAKAVGWAVWRVDS